MRRPEPTRVLPFILTSCFALWHCGGPADAPLEQDVEGVVDAEVSHAQRAEPESDGSLGSRDASDDERFATASCRRMAASATVVVDGATGQQTCEFAAAALRHVCSTTFSDGRSETSSVAYASVADFVEAGLHAGKVTSLSAEHRGADGETRIEHFFDDIGRLTRSVATGPGGALVRRYTAHDSHGRPQREWRSGAAVDALGCSGIAFALEYDDAAHTLTRRAEPESAACASIGDELERQDVFGNTTGVSGTASLTGVPMLAARVEASPSGFVSICE